MDTIAKPFEPMAPAATVKLIWNFMAEEPNTGLELLSELNKKYARHLLGVSI
jgi:hypothetical protein